MQLKISMTSYTCIHMIESANSSSPLGQVKDVRTMAKAEAKAHAASAMRATRTRRLRG